MMMQQGDILLKKINNFPNGVKSVIRKEKGFVLAEGESSGHAHVIEDDIELVEKDGILYMFNKESVTIKHEEHGHQVIEPGIYEIGIVKEYDPFEKEIRNVKD